MSADTWLNDWRLKWRWQNQNWKRKVCTLLRSLNQKGSIGIKSIWTVSVPLGISLNEYPVPLSLMFKMCVSPYVWIRPSAHTVPSGFSLFSCFTAFLFFFFLILFIYLWLRWVFVSAQGLSPVAASGGHSSSRCAGLSLSRPLLLRSTGSRCAGSAIVAHGPSCSAACGIFPDQGSNPCPLHWQADSQPLRHQGSPSLHFLMSNIEAIFQMHTQQDLCKGWRIFFILFLILILMTTRAYFPATHLCHIFGHIL